MKHQRRWWMIPLALIPAVLITAVVLWPTLKVYLAPKTVLTAALTNTYDALEQRMKNSPITLISNALDIENGNTFDLELETASEVIGPIRYDMDIQTQWAPKRISARGQVKSQARELDLSMYLDGDFAAVSSDDILQGNYYGLTYDTFSQDIRNNQLLSMVIGEKTLNEWEEGVGNLQTSMAGSLKMPRFSEADFKSILVGILTLEAAVDRESIMVNGISEDYYVISFDTTGAAIASGIDYLKAELPVSLNPNEEVEISFWLKNDAVVKIELDAGERDLDLYCGVGPVSVVASDDLFVQYEDSGNLLTVQISTQQDAHSYQEIIKVTGAETAEVFYNWSLETGELTLDVNREGEISHISARLIPAENGFHLETGDFEGLMHLLLGTADSVDSPCVITMTKGAEIITPSYKNFSEWSFDDLATLLGGIGGLLGFKIV